MPTPTPAESPEQTDTPDAAADARNRGALHWIIVLVVFSITGSLSLFTSELILRGLLGLEGTFWGGPWAYRLAYLLLITPAYSVLLATIGTLLGKGPYFRERVVKMWRRLLPGFVANRLFGAPAAPRRAGV